MGDGRPKDVRLLSENVELLYGPLRATTEYLSLRLQELESAGWQDLVIEDQGWGDSSDPVIVGWRKETKDETRQRLDAKRKRMEAIAENEVQMLAGQAQELTPAQREKLLRLIAEGE